LSLLKNYFSPFLFSKRSFAGCDSNPVCFQVQTVHQACSRIIFLLFYFQSGALQDAIAILYVFKSKQYIKLAQELFFSFSIFKAELCRMQ